MTPYGQRAGKKAGGALTMFHVEHALACCKRRTTAFVRARMASMRGAGPARGYAPGRGRIPTLGSRQGPDSAPIAKK